MSRHLVVGMVATLLAACSVHAGDAARPHPHQGFLKPYRPPPPLVLSTTEQQRLLKGEDVIRPFGGGDIRPAIVFRVNAAPDIVWAVIADFRSLPRYIAEVKKVDVVEQEGERTVTKLTLGQMGITLEEFVDNRYHGAAHWGTWTLDYRKESDLDDSVGFWRVTPGDTAGSAIVEYAAEVRAMSWAPGFVQGMINDKAMRDTPQWVRRFSEASAATKTPSSSSPAAPATSP